MTPEEKARQKIDRMFEDAGWAVVDRDHYSPTLSAAAIKEGLLNGNLEADYFLFINGKAVGVLEAKHKGIDVSGDVVMEQAHTYAKNVPDCYQAIENPLPLIYTSNGENVFFEDFRKQDGNIEQIDRIHTPKEIVKKLGIPDYWAALPTLRLRGLRDCQFEAITELEKSFRTGQNRALMVLATGAGKTYTAVTASYRFLNYTPMRRVLFLVDRNNLAKQAESEFGTYRLTESGDAFNTIYGVERLKSSRIPDDANVVISTIQRVFSLLTGQEIVDSDEDDEDTITDDIQLGADLKLPHDFFDLIIIDECHRSIYGKWKKVLNHFDMAKLIGLTATPVPETLAFFNYNRVVNYTLERSIIDGVNVGCCIYRIRTEATENGGAIRKGDKLKRETVYTGQVETIDTKASKDYTPEELNRSIINPSQIKLILETFRDAVYDEMFNDPQRERNLDYLPKTLIFALNERHASNIVKIAKEVFGKEEDDKFVQKITYSSGDSNELIRRFRNDKDFRIAVTCTLVATGTDVRPLEVVMFMRDVSSEPLYIQMKGRGVRTIDDDMLRNVTPNAISKDYYILVDAVGVTEHTMTTPAPGQDDEPSQTITLKRLLELLTHGDVRDAYLNTLAGRLARISNKCDEDQREEFVIKTHGFSMAEISSNIYAALESGDLPPYISINEPNNERKGLVAALVNHPDAKQYLLVLNAGFVNTLQPGEDKLITKGFSQEEAQETISAFERYCEEHKDEIEALRILYNNTGERITYGMLTDLERRLREHNSRFTSSSLWNNYAILYPDRVKQRGTKEEMEALTNIIQLVRFALHQTERLESLYPQANSLFNLWWGRVQKDITEAQVELLKQIVSYVASNGFSSVSDIKENYDKSLAARLIRAFSGKVNADAALDSMARFILYRKSA